MKSKTRNRIHSILWVVATIFEWINVILFIAAMGYPFEIPIYTQMRTYPHIATIYYVAAAIDITLFWVLAMMNRKNGQEKNMLLAIYCFVIQVALLLYKIKL